MTRVARQLAALTLLSAAPIGLASMPERVENLRDLLAEGYYALAAQVEGPKVVEAYPGSARAHLLYAEALYLVGNRSAAHAQLERVKTLKTTAQEQRRCDHLEALLQADAGFSANALTLLESVFSASPSYEVAMDWGRVAWQAGELTGAARAYRFATKTPAGKSDPWAHLALARVLLQQNEAERAVEALEAALVTLEAQERLRPSPAYPEVFFRLGEAYEHLGRVDQAISNYQAAQAVEPSYTAALDALERLAEAP